MNGRINELPLELVDPDMKMVVVTIKHYKFKLQHIRLKQDLFFGVLNLNECVVLFNLFNFISF